MSRIKKWRQLQEKKEEGTPTNKIMVVGLIVLFGGAVLFFAFSNSNSVTGLASAPIGNVHWHATAELSVCGETKPIPVPFPGQHHKGLPLMHTHDDEKLHIEGFVGNPSDITLGKFMQAIGVQFSNDQFFDKKNGDTCPNGMQGNVKLLVNDQENPQLANYSIKDGDRFEILFE